MERAQLAVLYHFINAADKPNIRCGVTFVCGVCACLLDPGGRGGGGFGECHFLILDKPAVSGHNDRPRVTVSLRRGWAVSGVDGVGFK